MNINPAPREEEPWEKILGKNTYDRTKALGIENANYRKQVNLPNISADVQLRHNIYIHQIGAEVLQTKFDEKKEAEMAKAALKKKLTKVGKLLRRKIKVSDLEDGGVSIAIDQEWDTSTWSDELIEAGCEALILIFYEQEHSDSGGSSVERKERAVQMLQKLLARHPVAELYVRRNVELMIGKATSKLLKGGKCGGLLDLLYILNSCKENFFNEMSQFNFNGKALEMLVQEAKCAAIIIQHSFRAKRYNSALKNPAVVIEGFGSEKQARMDRLGVVNARSAELRAKWRSMRWYHSDKVCAMPGGLRGPIHVGPVYTLLALEIILYLLSSKAGKYAQSNREDIVRSNGCILLATYLAYPTGKFCFVSAAIVANISKVSESFEPLQKSGCLYATVKVMKYLRTIGIGTQNIKEKKNIKFSLLQAYLDCLDIIYFSAVHAAGLFRAHNGYNYIREPTEEVEKIDYQQVLNRLTLRKNLSKDVNYYLGSFTVLKEICSMIMQTNHATVLMRCMRAVLAILCSHAHIKMVTEITALNGVLAMKLTELIHAKDSQIGTLALSIFLQMCTVESTRRAMLNVEIPKYLVPLNRMTTDFNKKYHQRSLLAACALCRQYEWRFYDPQSLPEVLQSSDDVLRKTIYTELLKTMKQPPPEMADTMQIADLVVLPTNDDLALEMSKLLSIMGPLQIMEFICHPDNDTYYEFLPVDESAATCVLLEGFLAHVETGKQIFSTGIVRFIAKYTYLSKYLFLGKPMADGQIMVILNGIQAGVVAMGRLCAVCEDSLERAHALIGNIRSTEFVASVLFFMNTLSVAHPKLETATHELQRQVGLSCLTFFNFYAKLLTCWQGRSKIAQLQDLYTPGCAVINLITLLKSVHSKSHVVVIIFDRMCQLLQKICAQPEAAYMAVQEWKIIDALRGYLPPPLSGVIDEELLALLNRDEPVDRSEISSAAGSAVGSFAERETVTPAMQRRHELLVYRMSLEHLPGSFFELCANLCQTNDGIAFCLAEGFLRRALDKLVLLNHTLSRVPAGASLEKYFPSWSSAHRELIGSLRLVSKCANFHRRDVGNANDMIFFHFYNIVGICKVILRRNEIPRSDELILVTYDALAAMSRDAYRISGLLEEHDIYSVIRNEFLCNIELLPARGASSALEVLHYSTIGLTSDYIVHMIPLLREPMMKVARIHPSVDDKVREANWTLTKSAMIYKSTVDSNLKIVTQEQALAVELEEFIRSGKVDRRADQLALLPENTVSTVLPNDSVTAETTFGSIVEPSLQFHNSVAAGHDPTHTHSVQDAGTLHYCGVSSCGSLRLPMEQLDWGHGQFSLVTEKDREQQRMRYTHSDPSLLPLSQLSAREKGLQRLMEERKIKHGFQEPPSPPPKRADVSNPQPLRTVSSVPSLVTASSSSSPLKGGEHSYATTATGGTSRNQGAPLLPKSPHKTSSKGSKTSKGSSTGAVPMTPPKMTTILLQDLPELILTRPTR